MPLEPGQRAQIKLQGNMQDGRAGRPDFPGGWGSWGIKNQGILILSKLTAPTYLRFTSYASQGFNLSPEYVEFENYGTATVDLTNFMIVSHALGTFPCPLPTPEQNYVFASGSYIAPGQKARVYSGTGASPANQNPPVSYFWNTQSIWLNSPPGGDVADLYDPYGTLLDSLAYGTCAPP